MERGGGEKTLRLCSCCSAEILGESVEKESVCVYTDGVSGFHDHTSLSNTLGTRCAIVGADNNGLRLKHRAICLVEYTLLALSEVLLGQMYAVFT